MRPDEDLVLTDEKENSTPDSQDAKAIASHFRAQLSQACPKIKISATSDDITALFQGLIDQSNQTDAALAAHIPPTADQKHAHTQAGPIQIIQDTLRPSLNKTCERLLDQITWLYGEHTRNRLTFSLGIAQLSCLVGVLPNPGFDFSASLDEVRNTGYHYWVLSGEPLQNSAGDLSAITNRWGETLAHFAAWGGHIAMVDHLIKEHGLNKNAKSKYGDTLLHFAALGGHIAMVDYLIKEHGLNKDAKCNGGGTLLHYAARGGHIAMVDHLISTHGLNKDAKANDGLTLLHYAALGGHIAMVDHLIKEHKLKKDAKSNGGWTLLHYAAWGEHIAIVCHLIECYNFDPNRQTSDRKTPLDLAISHGHSNISEALITLYGVSGDCKESKKIDPLDELRWRAEHVQHVYQAFLSINLPAWLLPGLQSIIASYLDDPGDYGTPTLEAKARSISIPERSFLSRILFNERTDYSRTDYLSNEVQLRYQVLLPKTKAQEVLFKGLKANNLYIGERMLLSLSQNLEETVTNDLTSGERRPEQVFALVDFMIKTYVYLIESEDELSPANRDRITGQLSMFEKENPSANPQCLIM